MNENVKRREFIKLSLASGCLTAFGKTALAEDVKNTELSCDQQLKRKQDDVWAGELKEKLGLLKKLKKKLGDDVVNITSQHTADGLEKKYAEMKIEKRDLNAVKSLLWDTLPKDQFKFENIEDSEERLEFRVSKCFLADLVKELDAPELSYALICAWDDGFCRGVNQDMKFTRTKTLINGDDCCNHTYELKKMDIKIS